MSQQVLQFEAPFWRKSYRPRLGLGALLLGSAAWLLVYGGLGWRLWRDGVNLGDTLNLWLIGLCIVMGVVTALAWWAAWPRLAWRWRREGWPPLNLDQLQDLSPSEFEEYVARRLFVRKGYSARNTRDVKDGGIDILVTDRFGQTAVVQCKRYKGTVGEPIVRDLYGTMIGNGASYAYLVTTGSISDEAQRWAAGKPIALIDGQQLVELARAA